MNEDHRNLGRRLTLFETAPIIGTGLPIWMPDGAVIRSELEKLGAEFAERAGCHRVYTPMLAKKELFERSGHWDKFADDMFPTMRVGGEDLVLRPANCPSHVQVYAAVAHSWRDLPVRLSENASMFRSELSGVLGGLNRVRQITLDDAHVFCRESQVVDEVASALESIEEAYRVLGIEVLEYRLSVRGPKGHYSGEDESWHAAEAELIEALDRVGVDSRRGEDQAAFYGPKIDVQVKDAAGREETLSTVQVDRWMPQRFGLRYTAPDGTAHRPVMIHRGLFGSTERLTALLIERFQGTFPTWLAPEQVRVLPVDGRHHGEAARALVTLLRAQGIRAVATDRGSLGSRVRDAREHHTSYSVVLGDREISEHSVSVEGQTIQVTAFVEGLTAEISEREIRRRFS